MSIRALVARTLAVIVVASAFAAPSRAQTHPTAPAFSSRPGAAYTLYLNFGGFNFTGNWGGSFAPGNGTPGNTAAYTTDGDATTFSTAEQANIKNVWSRVAEKYVAYNVNVTTVDPAVTAGQGTTDATRQAYYDSNARMMHTVIGGSGSWTGGGGVSYLSVAQNSYSTASQNGGAGAGLHTNWVFAAQSATNLQFVAEATAHEDGHALKLDHQNRWVAGAFNSEYDSGTGTGTGSVAPIMGNSYSAQRGTWRVGDYATARNASGTPTARGTQNDAGLLLTNTGIAGNGTAGFMDSGVGHTTGTATALPLAGSAITAASAVGFIAPNATAPNPIGEANYTTDYFTFTVGAGGANLTVNLISGRSTITAGAADPGATLNGTLRLRDAAGTVLATANTGVLSETITSANLPAGVYYLQVSSAGGQTDGNGYMYFDMGSYFLTGSLVPVPEPVAVLALCAAAVVGVWRRRVGASRFA